MTIARWAGVTLGLVAAGLATGLLLASVGYFTIEYGPVVGGAVTAAVLLSLLTIPWLARAVRRVVRGSSTERARYTAGAGRFRTK